MKPFGLALRPTKPHVQWIPDHFNDGKQLGRGVDHPPPVALTLRMSGTIPPLSLFLCMAGYWETFTCNGFSLLSNVASTVTFKTQWEILIFLFYSILAYYIPLSVRFLPINLR